VGSMTEHLPHSGRSSIAVIVPALLERFLREQQAVADQKSSRTTSETGSDRLR